jgi:undecaprenyl-diphosphatase
MMAQKIFLGVIQGLTEFLPVSSSAHLVLIPRYFHWADPGLAFDVALHLGTLAAVVLFFRRDLIHLLEAALAPSDPSRAPARRLLVCLALATVPGALAGLLLEHKAETLFRSPVLIAWTLIGMGLLLGVADRFLSGRKTLEGMSWPLALLIGAAQSLALVPGISRSGITITMALAMGFRREESARFSFLMSVPIIAGAGLLKMKEILHAADKAGLLAGFSASALFGFAAIWLLMRYVQTRRYTPFVLYRCLLGVFVLIQISRFI